MTEITVTVSGPVGCGKSAIAGEIEIALRAVGVPVRFADEKEARSEKNMTGADWAGYIDMYKPIVVIDEQIRKPSDLDDEEADAVCREADGCPTEKAVLQRFWREHHNTPPETNLVGLESDPATLRGYCQQLLDILENYQVEIEGEDNDLVAHISRNVDPAHVELPADAEGDQP